MLYFPPPLTIGNLLQGSQYVNEELTLGFVNGSRVCILWMGREVVAMDFMWAGQISWVRVEFFVDHIFNSWLVKKIEEKNKNVHFVNVEYVSEK